MKKPVKKKLVLDRETIRALDTELTQVVGGKNGCTYEESTCRCGIPVMTFIC